MIYLIHNKANTFEKAFRNDEALLLKSINIVDAFWELALAYPEEILVWVEKQYRVSLDAEYFRQLFRHQNIMASYPIETRFFSDDIGYIDQLPFVNPKRDIKYPTWLMTTDVGAIYGNTALKFRSLFKDIKSFGYLLNSIAKLGQQNSLFCYSDPGLVKDLSSETDLIFGSSQKEFFSFISEHYKKERLWLVLFCFIKFKGIYSIKSFLASYFKSSFFKKNISLRKMELAYEKDIEEDIDIIIPTLFRAKFLQNFLQDLRSQSHLPKRVIIIEQNPDSRSKSELDFLKGEWPFKIIHHFIHRTGACYSRNLALTEVKSEWILFADDDIRIENNLLENIIKELKRTGFDCFNLNSLQTGEKTTFAKIKQWGAFGSANAIVKKRYALDCGFSEELEFGYGEDIDYGMQLREKGCDIIYHPELKFHHLKATRGGFRTSGINEWKLDEIEPKPSPTMMYLIRKYYSKEMIRGYKVTLFLKFFRKQAIRNPFRYYRLMQKRWKKSEKLFDRLQAKAID